MTLSCASVQEAPPILGVGPADEIEGVVTSARGATVLRVGDRCSVRLQRTDHAVLDCRVQVRCAAERIYGLVDAGYNRCRQRDGQLVAARDAHGTRDDGDPKMSFDRAGGWVEIVDEDPALEVRIALAR